MKFNKKIIGCIAVLVVIVAAVTGVTAAAVNRNSKNVVFNDVEESNSSLLENRSTEAAGNVIADVKDTHSEENINESTDEDGKSEEVTEKVEVEEDTGYQENASNDRNNSNDYIANNDNKEISSDNSSENDNSSSNDTGYEEDNSYGEEDNSNDAGNDNSSNYTSSYEPVVEEPTQPQEDHVVYKADGTIDLNQSYWMKAHDASNYCYNSNEMKEFKSYISEKFKGINWYIHSPSSGDGPFSVYDLYWQVADRDKHETLVDFHFDGSKFVED